ncbi:hypothetical protein MmiEs2_05530 [Methanimicrococcus stummii]|uniref:Uncharacterized protein n=1 Tax=Methanimicrococcus stummii TaxID=3028294 RepID=A0AA96VAN9_9EURY|nr:hypothetical protein [Methanimicrococcus sp. Es2]WNY28368.1 hypothetical protein MmiEs2_05530 [Methanimicrococcus sp. Es2]
MKLTADEKFLFQEKTVSALLFIYRIEVTYISEVSENIESNFAHTNKIIKRLESMGFLSSVFEGRSRFLKLTPKGYAFAQKLSAAFEVCKSDETFEFPEGYVPERKIQTADEDFTDSLSASALSGNSAPVFENKFVNPKPKSKSNLSGAPLSIMDRIKVFGLKIKEIYDELIEADADKDLFQKRFGEFDRELKIIGAEIEKLGSDDESKKELLAAYRAAEMQYSFYLEK